ncbi:MAG: metabolite traffic protein EboE [Planctomycetes bacterium]|nr:metabolite traffic protein EboE [Planctomycetota bacterium]
MNARLAGRYKPILGYSTNVHRGETLEQIYRFLRDYTIPVKERVFGREPAGLELRLGIGGARDLRAAGARRRFGEFLAERGLKLFSINAYPLLDYHARRVKEKVYEPSWTEDSRARWTIAIARIFADLLPPGVEGSISTLGGAYRRKGQDLRTLRRIAARYLRVIDALLEIERSGRRIVLAVEPEPETTFETARDFVEFTEDEMLPLALERRRGRTRGRVEEDVRRLFTVNLDTCHLSTLFEDPVVNLRLLEKAGLRLGKLHVTSALAVKDPFRSPAAYADLRSLDEPRYLHQFCGAGRDGTVIWRGLDLDELPPRLVRGEHPGVVELRSHFHAPVYLRRFRRLWTTRDETERVVRHVVRRRLTEHLVVETYTWPLFAGRGDQRARLVRGIARELRWLRGVLTR